MGDLLYVPGRIRETNSEAALRIFLLLWLCPLFAWAHPLAAVQVEATFSKDRYQIEASFKLRDLFIENWPEAEEKVNVSLPSGVDPRYQSFVAQYIAASRASFDGSLLPLQARNIEIKDIPDETGLTAPVRALVIQFEGKLPSEAKHFSWSNTLPLGSYVLVCKQEINPSPSTEWLLTGQESKPFSIQEGAAPQSTGEIIATYIGLGFTHILPLGLDHVLFVLGLFFLCTRLSPMLWQVSAFTAAHTITLALTAYGVVSLPSSIIEPIIAASIAYVGIENIVRRELKRSRVFLVFGFGLLHGMGFAGVLQEIGIPSDALFTSLISFNVGVELGQLAVLLLAFLLVGIWTQRKEWYRSRVAIPASALIALAGVYWAVERVYESLAQ